VTALPAGALAMSALPFVTAVSVFWSCLTALDAGAAESAVPSALPAASACFWAEV
jgi:hypothetical protein